MKIKINYFVIPGFTILVAFLGKQITQNPIAQSWYNTKLLLPSITPPRWIFPLAWNSIFLFTTIAALIVWNYYREHKNFVSVITLFVFNGVLNILWSVLFFSYHWIGIALIDAIALQVVTIYLTILIAQFSKKTALLLIPYIAWNMFAIYLNYRIFMIN